MRTRQDTYTRYTRAQNERAKRKWKEEKLRGKKNLSEINEGVIFMFQQNNTVGDLLVEK